MPTKISVTNIEMMIRNPYGFYVKHILKIKPLKSSIPELKLSEFGIFIHAILEKYTKNYNIENYSNKLDTIINIAKSIYEDLNKIYQTPISWLYKFQKIAQSFIEFDENRRSNISYVLSESYGEIDLLIGKRNLKITAIADRIEVSKNNEIYILDYKTGTVPTIKSVYQGLSPQLIVEAIIAKYGYFTNLESNNITKIIYVKISISEPYFTCTEIEINEEILSSTLENLKKLLNYYYDSDHIRINKSELKIPSEYNDYLHMMRIVGYS
jgi:ATP-dependent helicase/nuclease subunit B